MAHAASGNLKSKIQSSFGFLLAIFITTASLFSLPSSAPNAAAEAVISRLGADIVGEALGDFSGFSVALSSDGSRVAIGAHYNDGNGSNSGHVRIYDWNGSDWVQVGGDINGEAADDQSGLSVALSSDGSRVAIGAQYNDGNGSNSGHIRIYDYDGVNDDADGIDKWTKVGGDINGEAAGDYSGFSVALSSDGSRVAIGAYANDGNGSNSGHVRVYELNSGTWTQLGSDIDGEAANDQSGFSVALSSDGSRVAIGAYTDDLTGRVGIYDWNGSAWVQVGSDIDGEAAGDYSGHSVALSSDGSRVAIGAPFKDANVVNDGYVRIFSLEELEAALTPTFASPAQTSDGFTVQVSNYDANYSWSVSASAGSATISGTGLITVTGLSAGASATVTVDITRSGYSSGSANVSSSAFTTLIPAFSTPTKTSDGFTVQVSNYDANFTWSVSASAGSATISGTGLITVTGLSAGASSTITAQTTRSGYTAGSATVASSALEAALTPTFATSTETSDGFTVQVSNYDANFTWSVSASAGSATISGTGLITVTGLSAGASSTITAQTTRSGYAAGSATVSGSALEAAPAAPAPIPAYTGPTLDSKQSVIAGEQVSFTGRRLHYVSSAYAGTTKLTIVSGVSKLLVLDVPASLAAGSYDLVLYSSNGKLTFHQGLTISAPAPEVTQPEVIEPEVVKKLTVGTFKGFIAIYSQGYEGAKLSAKVAGKWLVVDALDESFMGNNYSRTVRFTGAGYDILVHLYINGELIKTEELMTQ
ncbi:FG-GAP repeat protein [Aquiluna sp.]|nr:FG-GAP repeat protein [Aquiluna sp.]